jgi:hypothetical protein
MPCYCGLGRYVHAPDTSVSHTGCAITDPLQPALLWLADLQAPGVCSLLLVGTYPLMKRLTW